MEPVLRASELLRRPVCFRDIRLGLTVDLILDEGARRLVGLDVLCGDRVHRYLPLAACETGGDSLAVPSALVLMAQELEFYRRRGRSLTALRGFPVRRGAADEGILEDLTFTPAGDVSALVVRTEGTVRELAPGSGLTLGGDALRPAV